MALNIMLELSDEDLKYFSRVLNSVWKQHSKLPESDIVSGARELIKQARKSKAPSYVMRRLDDIKLLIELLGDKEWALDAEDRRRILAAISYFAVKKDIIPDKVLGIGYLDDALMAELVIRELKHDLEGYRDFVAYRESELERRGKVADREQWLSSRRAMLMERVRRRRERMWERRRETSATHPILRYKY